jgi:hypothetical protein
MPSFKLEDVTPYVQENIPIFHQKRIQSLDSLQLKRVLQRKNPYLYRAKNVCTAEELVRGIVDAHITKAEETIFGDWLEGLAIYINAKVYGGIKSGILGIDLEFDHGGNRYIVSIKSGPNWGNSSQISKMITYFKTAQRTLRTSNSQVRVVAVNGCCYGFDDQPDKGDYFKYCGQRFWEFVSGDPNFYLEIVQPLGHQALEMNEQFQQSYQQTTERIIAGFAEEFCNANHEIDWEKLVRFNSEARK